MLYNPCIEIEADFSGSDPDHLQVGEVRYFNNEDSTRVFMLESGPFYKDSLKLFDVTTGIELKAGKDYVTSILDKVACLKSGQDVCGLVEVINYDLTGVVATYQFVGGIHASGVYILQHLMEMYPEGKHVYTDYTDILNRPDKFDASYHRHHIRQLFNSDQLLVWLERIRAGVNFSNLAGLNLLYDALESRIDVVITNLNTAKASTNDTAAQMAEMLKVQDNEYIFTDDPSDPAVKRLYGKWVPVTGVILKDAGDSAIVGAGNKMQLGSEQIIRNTYLFKNTANGVDIKPTLNVTKSANSISEGSAISFNFNSTNLPNNTMLSCRIVGTDSIDVVSGFTGKVTINNNTAILTVNFAIDNRNEGDKTYQLLVDDFPEVVVSFKVTNVSNYEWRSNTQRVVADPIDPTAACVLEVGANGWWGDTIGVMTSATTVRCSGTGAPDHFLAGFNRYNKTTNQFE